MISLRPYQQRAVLDVLQSWRDGARRVCLVLPTGAGKTVTAQAVAQELGGRALWLVHRRELAAQAPGQAVTIQALVASGRRPECDVLIADECHHLAPGAAEWNAAASSYPRILGLTATPQRQDGSPLGDLFDHLVVGAHYSELIEGGWLVRARVFRPVGELEGAGVAMEPVQAWRRFAGERRGFAFFSRVESAQKFVAAVNELGHEAAAVWGAMEGRDEAIARFRAGRTRCLANVQILTEGVDMPEASLCMLAGGCGHASGYLQRVGRILRPAPGKTDAVLLDLVGASHRWGLPHEDREYSLTGAAITTKAKLAALTVCAACGATYPSAEGRCPECGRVPEARPAKVRVWGVAIEEVTGELSAKQRGILRYREKLAQSPERLRALYRELRQKGVEKGFKPGWAAVQFKVRTGRWPSSAEIR